jgi:hypothetical protein
MKMESNDDRKFDMQPSEMADTVDRLLSITGGEAVISFGEHGLEAFIPNKELSNGAFFALGSTMLTHSSNNARFKAIYSLSENALRKILDDEDEFKSLEVSLQKLLLMALGRQ